MIFAETVQNLSARLPELEWKLKSLNITLTKNKVPANLFHYQFDMTPQTCIAEIKADLQLLSTHSNERSIHYLAQRISQKINVLVQLCQLHVHRKIPERQSNFGIRMISTRQQWLQTIEDDIIRFTEQQQALAATLHELQKNGNQQMILNVQAELGEAERRLTLAQETLARSLY